MNEKKPSLGDQLKQAELERLRSEIDKNKAEEALSRKQLTEVWYSGRSLRLIIGGIITAATLGGIFYTAVILPLVNLDKEIAKREAELADKKSQLAQVQIDSLNREKVKITSTIDSLNIRSIISANFGNLDSASYTNVLEKYKMIVANNYYDRRLNPRGTGSDNKFELQTGDSIVYDAATGLYWQQGGSTDYMTFADAQKFVAQLNRDQFAGFDDWRLPTLEEAMSLMERELNESGLYIDPVFDETQVWIWTADRFPASGAWLVDFYDGGCNWYNFYHPSVRVVR